MSEGVVGRSGRASEPLCATAWLVPAKRTVSRISGKGCGCAGGGG